MFDLKRFRKDNKLTQQMVADMFGCLPSNISMIEKKLEITEDQRNILIKQYGIDTIDKYNFIEQSMNNDEIVNNLKFENESLKREIEHLKERLKDKEEIIEILKAQKNNVSPNLTKQTTKH